MQGKKPLFGLTVGADEVLARAIDFGVDFCDLHFGGRVEALPAIQEWRRSRKSLSCWMATANG